MIIQTFYAGQKFSSRNLLDLAAGGTFMSITLDAATKLLDNMMVNYFEWHTERAPQGKKVNSVEETSSLSDKIDTIMAICAPFLLRFFRLPIPCLPLDVWLRYIVVAALFSFGATNTGDVERTFFSCAKAVSASSVHLNLSSNFFHECVEGKGFFS
jgi:hypothetical protein